MKVSTTGFKCSNGTFTSPGNAVIKGNYYLCIHPNSQNSECKKGHFTTDMAGVSDWFTRSSTIQISNCKLNTQTHKIALPELNTVLTPHKRCDNCKTVINGSNFLKFEVTRSGEKVIFCVCNKTSKTFT